MGAATASGLGGSELALVAFVAAGLFLLLAALVAPLLVGRRRLRRDARALVLALEELRAGRTRHRPEIEASSPLALVADAAARLGQDLHVRLGEAEETAERLAAVLDTMRHAALITTDLDGDVRSVSEAATTLLGWGRDDLVSRPVALLFAEGAYEVLLPRLTRRAERERGVELRSTLKRRDGSTFPADITVRALHRAGREPMGFLIVAQDVTASVRTEQELAASETRHRRLVEAFPVGAALVRAGRIVYANPAFAALCGADADRLTGARLRDQIATADVLLLEERLLDVETSGRARAVRCAWLGSEEHPGGAARLELSRVEDGEGGAVLVLAHDETAMRRAEAELRRNQARLDAVLEAATDGILLLSDGPEGAIASVTNRAFLDLLQLEPGEVLGRSETTLLGILERRQGGHATLAALLRAERNERPSAVLRLGGAAPRELRASVLPLHDATGAPIGRVVACRDITPEREAARRLQQHADELQLRKVQLEQAYHRLDAAHAELGQRAAEQQRLNEELRKLDEMKSNLLGNVSHELQTPLVSIRGYTEIILKERLGPVTAEQRKGLTLCLRNTDRLIALIDGLVALSRAESEPERLRLSRFPLHELVEEARQVMAGQIDAAGLGYTVDLGPLPFVIQADRDKILQVLLNLLSNAIKFNAPGGSIDVRARPGPAGFVRVEVADTGRGIAAEDRERIFERHERGTAETTAGRGLGLAIVRDILRRHGCRIELTSEPGRGSRFEFTLPLGAENGSDAAKPGDGPAAPTDTIPDPDGPRAARTPPGQATPRLRLRLLPRAPSP